MKRYKLNKGRKSISRVWSALFILAIILVVGIIVDRSIYNSLLKPVSDSKGTTIFKVESGESAKSVSDKLNSEKLIRSSWAMQLYLHAHNLTDRLQAGSFMLSPSQSTAQIAEILTSGKVQSDLITILPGNTIFQVKDKLVRYGYTRSEVDYALNINNYKTLSLFQFVPKGTNTLEGLLWPDSFARSPNTPLTYIITESLNEMNKQLTPSVQSAFASRGLSVYQGITLTSIVNQEVNKYNDQTQVAQVFYSRLKNGSKLGSDVTANYGAVASGRSPSLSYDSPYNTLIHTGLPPTPISTISASALKATTNPASTSWLYFVAGDNGTTYFSNTFEEQQANTAKYCHKLCALP